MASTTFIDNQTTIYAAWLNDVNNAVYNGIFVSTSVTATNFVCNGTASGTGFTNLINNSYSAPGAIGSATPNTGAFTTLSLTSPLAVSYGGTGLSSVGTSGYALASNGGGLFYKRLGLAMTGETWHNLTGSRVKGTTYTNPNDYPIMVNVISATGGNGELQFSVNGAIVATSSVEGISSGMYTLSVIVPPYTTYAVNGASGVNFSAWIELY
jgi:hypothetical protein